MNEEMLGFVEALREANVKVSQSEVVDALQSVGAIDILDRDLFRCALGATLVKDIQYKKLFDRLFDVFFPAAPTRYYRQDQDQGAEIDESDQSEQRALEIRRQLVEALLNEDQSAIRAAIKKAVTSFSGMEKGRPVGGVYYTYRTLRQLDLEDVVRSFLYGLAQKQQYEVVERTSDRSDRAMRLIRSEVDSEVLRRLVGDRGSSAVARTLALRLPEDVDIVHASREEIEDLQRLMIPMAKKLATRLAQRHLSTKEATMDFRKTMREAMSYGGTPADLYFHKPKVSKPEIVLISDISGSVASFARFTMQLLYVMSGSFSKMRSFVFIDTIDEVTGYFKPENDVNESLRNITTKAKVVGLDGHSDYGNSLDLFEKRYLDAVTKRTTLIICGDARSNYHPGREDVLRRLKERSRHIYWLNPEPKSYWNSGDSIISTYIPYCDGVFECRTLRQLEEFISTGV